MNLLSKIALACALLAAPAYTQSFVGHAIALQTPQGLSPLGSKPALTLLSVNVPSGTTGIGGTISVVSSSATARVPTCYATPIGGAGTGALAAVNSISGSWTGNLSMISAGSGYSSVPTSWQITNQGTAFACSGTLTVTGGTLVSGAASVAGFDVNTDLASGLGLGFSASASSVTVFEGTSATFTGYAANQPGGPLQFIVTDTTGGATITGVTVDAASSVSGFGAPQVTFDSTHIYLTVGGLSMSWGQQITLDVTF